jgi:precorrin-2 dehydrogenase/sirohydrochlorin ferrochelatase
VVIAATNDPKLIQAIWAETQERGQLVNIVDVPEYCSFIVPSVLRRGQLTIAVSTEGASPSLAKRVRQSLEELFPPAYDTYVQLAALARTYLRKNGVSYERRDDFFSDFFTSDVLARLVEGNTVQATVVTAALLQKYDVDVPAHVLEAALGRDKSGGKINRPSTEEEKEDVNLTI